MRRHGNFEIFSAIVAISHKFVCKMIQRKWRMKAIGIFSFLLVVLMVCDYLGVYAYLFASDYFNEFSYPLEGNVMRYVKQIRSGRQPDVNPINVYNYSFLLSNDSKCVDKKGKEEKIRLLLLVKSATTNFDRRRAIRESWGWEKRFSDVKIRTVFLVGVDKNNAAVQTQLTNEHRKYGDIVQSEFRDTYYNNTIKTMQGFRWAVEKCPKADFYMFSDDDMYVSMKNVLRFVRNPRHYPTYLTRAILQLEFEPFEVDEMPEILYAGFGFIVILPLRYKFSKWYISLDEYPYSRFPPFIAAGAFILSREALFRMFYTSMYTKHFRFDDVYLGLVAKKAGIDTSHNENFYFWRKDYEKDSFNYVIASHGYGNEQEMLHAWHEQRSLGNA